MGHLKNERRNVESGKMEHHETGWWRRAGCGIGATLWVLLTVLAFSTFSSTMQSAWAQQDVNPEQQPGAARASLIQDSVSMQRGDSESSGASGTWDAVTPNTPFFAGDVVSAGPGSRAEIQLDYANIVRLSDGANIRIANLSPSQIQIQVGAGIVSFTELKQSEGAIEIDTPNAAVHPLGPGNYRIRVDPSGVTQVTAWYNAADIVTQQGTARVERGQMMTIQGTDNPQYQTSAAPSQDDWDRWNVDRDRVIANAASWSNTNQYYVGSNDLDSYGQWMDVPDYGTVWAPAQTAGWAPYRNGRWSWEPFYGWTWVSYEPWGWAPYHYGRWFVYRDSWVWWPGPVRAVPAYRPLWAPAYVSFVGFGNGVGFSLSFSNVGWLPCGPADSFFPWYGRFGGRVNVVNIVDINNHRFDRSIGPLLRPGMHPYSNFQDALRDDHVRGGFSSMAANDFGHSRVPIAQRSWGAADFSRGGMITGGLPFAPGRDSGRSSDQPVNPRSIPSRSINSERFFSDGGRSRGPAPVSRGFNVAPNGGAPVSQPGWRGFGNENERIGSAPTVQRQIPAAPSVERGNTDRGNSASGWNSFRSGSSAAGQTAPGRGFTPQNSPYGRDNERGRGQGGVQGNGQGNGWQRFSGQPGTQANPQAAPQGQAAPGYGGRREWQQGRPPLDMRQPIVTRRGPEESGRPVGPPSSPRYSAPIASPSPAPRPSTNAAPSAGPGGRGEGRSEGRSQGRSDGGPGRRGR